MVFAVIACACGNSSAEPADTETTTFVENTEITSDEVSKEDSQQIISEGEKEDYIAETASAVYSQTLQESVPASDGVSENTEAATYDPTEAGEAERDFSEFE